MNKKFIIFILCFVLSINSEERRSKYFIALKKNQDNILNTLNTLDQFVSFLPPKNMLYADPMLFKHNGTNYLFFEEFDYKKGTIAYVTVGDDLQLSNPVQVLEFNHHLSFPHIFQEGDNIYMTPETYDLHEVGLYKSTDFPQKWENQRVLVSGSNFSDPILFKYNNYYWLFTTVNTAELCIYFSESLDGEFKPHPINTQKIQGRNAGRVFYLGNQFIRPVMDCSKIYGYSMILKEIVKLDPVEFIEKDIFRIEPTWTSGLNGTHTFNLNEDIVVYDGRRSILPSEDYIYSSN